MRDRLPYFHKYNNVNHAAPRPTKQPQRSRETTFEDSPFSSISVIKIVFTTLIIVTLLDSVIRIWMPVKHLGPKPFLPSCDVLPPDTESPLWNPFAILNLGDRSDKSACASHNNNFTPACLAEVNEGRRHALQAQLVGSMNYTLYEWNVERATCLFIQYAYTPLSLKDKCTRDYDFDFNNAVNFIKTHANAIQQTLCLNRAEYHKRRAALDGIVFAQILGREREILLGDYHVLPVAWTTTVSGLCVSGLCMHFSPSRRMKAFYAFIQRSPVHWSRYVAASLDARALNAEFSTTRAVTLHDGVVQLVSFKYEEKFEAAESEALYGVTPLQLSFAKLEFLFALLAMCYLLAARWSGKGNGCKQGGSWTAKCSSFKID